MEIKLANFPFRRETERERERDKKSVRSQVYDKYSQKKNGAALREYWYVNWR